MKPQNYDNHVRYYTWHHFTFYPLLLIAWGCSFACIFTDPGNRALWLAINALFLFIAWTAFMLRQHYALINQNRIIRLELRFRYFVLTQKRFEELEGQLAPRQIYALRFAPDAELEALTHRAISEKLSPDSIKRSIRNWLPDTMRV